jgi:hypothetical protein
LGNDLKGKSNLRGKSGKIDVNEQQGTVILIEMKNTGLQECGLLILLTDLGGGC